MRELGTKELDNLDCRIAAAAGYVDDALTECALYGSGNPSAIDYTIEESLLRLYSQLVAVRAKAREAYRYAKRREQANAKKQETP